MKKNNLLSKEEVNTLLKIIFQNSENDLAKINVSIMNFSKFL